MRVETGKYKTRAGQTAVVFTVKARGKYPCIGLVRYKSADEPASWTLDGKFDHSKDGCVCDLIERSDNEV